MMRNSTRPALQLVLLATIFFVVALIDPIASGAPAVAQAGGTAAPAPASPAPAGAPAAAAPEATTSVDDILAGEEEVLAGTTYSYDPGSRRDPFRSLLVAKNKAERKGALPDGIPGLLIEEIDLTGIFRTSRGFVAQVLASNKEKSYLIREGDQLYDGDVVSITQQEVVFKQIVSDPTVIKPFREVIKKLSP
jgi:Tfp pilus assembly protein PilP